MTANLNLRERPELSPAVLAPLSSLTSDALRLRPMLTNSLTHANMESLPETLKRIRKDVETALQAIEGGRR